MSVAHDVAILADNKTRAQRLVEIPAAIDRQVQNGEKFKKRIIPVAHPETGKREGFNTDFLFVLILTTAGPSR